MSLRTVSEPAAAPSRQDATAVAVRLEDVSVRYRVPRDAAGTFKEYVIARLRRGRPAYHEFWALRGVSLEVREREVFGIVGRNGAGKSTLLRVVSRILRPTAGRVVVRGRVAPLLDLGAGFHPELTGRENVFLNATLLGHGQREVAARLREIVEFAELEEFIDAPLRSYSNGMVARLGFAVATAWVPEILILDEILAVGDRAFQEKCRARIREFSQRGTTILLVAHDPEIIDAMCARALWLDRGAVAALGRAAEVSERYRYAGLSPAG
jgi:ABC-type polysaccharide/polyol phosphate transport system ATPase subunit